MSTECSERQHFPASRGGNWISLRLSPAAAERLRAVAAQTGRTEIGLAEELLEGVICDLAFCDAVR